jgi:cell shape-determining protein MreD
MKNYLLIFFLLFLGVIFQISFLNNLPKSFNSISLVFILFFIFSYLKEKLKIPPALIGFITGIFLDLFSVFKFGIFTLIFTILDILLSIFLEKFQKNNLFLYNFLFLFTFTIFICFPHLLEKKLEIDFNFNQYLINIFLINLIWFSFLKRTMKNL